MLIGTLHLPTDPHSKGPRGQGKRTFHLDTVSRFHLSGMRVPGALPHASISSMGKTRQNISSIFLKHISSTPCFHP